MSDIPQNLNCYATRNLERPWSMETYKSIGGYSAWEKILREKIAPADVIELVKASGLRGRGGAGFPTGMKWGFVPQDTGRPNYLVVNADESEPGACKDIPLLFANPHALIEGIAITCYAIRAKHAFVYIRGEVPNAHRRLRAAVNEAYAAGLLGKNVLGAAAADVAQACAAIGGIPTAAPGTNALGQVVDAVAAGAVQYVKTGN